jgi:1,4-alpha-glucan branching enzyme
MRPAYRSITKHITFRLNAPDAHKVQVVVCLIQDEAKPETHALRKGVDRVWSLRTELARGRYVYRFLVDGIPTLDPAARYKVTDGHGSEWNMREVGH